MWNLVANGWTYFEYGLSNYAYPPYKFEQHLCLRLIGSLVENWWEASLNHVKV